MKRQAAVNTQILLALHRMRGPAKEAHDFREIYRSELDRRTSLWPAVHDPLADTDTGTESSHSVEAAEIDAHNIEMDTPLVMGGLINEEVQAEGQRLEAATQEERELENIYRARDAIFAEEPGRTA